MKVSTGVLTSVTKLGFSIQEVCHSLGLSKGFVLQQIKHGKLNVRRLGRRVIVLDEDLRQYLEQAKGENPPDHKSAERHNKRGKGKRKCVY